MQKEYDGKWFCNSNYLWLIEALLDRFNQTMNYSHFYDSFVPSCNTINGISCSRVFFFHLKICLLFHMKFTSILLPVRLKIFKMEIFCSIRLPIGSVWGSKIYNHFWIFYCWTKVSMGIVYWFYEKAR